MVDSRAPAPAPQAPSLPQDRLAAVFEVFEAAAHRTIQPVVSKKSKPSGPNIGDVSWLDEVAFPSVSVLVYNPRMRQLRLSAPTTRKDPRMSTLAYRPNSETKQQLEELDALIQRMLGLPLGLEADSSAASASPLVNRPALSQEPAALPQTATLTIKPVPSTPSSPGFATTSSVQAWRVEMPAPPPVAEAIAAPEVPWATAIDSGAAPLPLPRFKLPPVVALPTTLPKFAAPAQLRPPVSPLTSLPPLAEQVSGAATAIPGPAAPHRVNVPSSSLPKMADEFPVPWILWPVVGFNRIVELLLFCLGPLGKVFTNSVGRNVAGALGILMILGAIGWGIADWLGVDWTR